MNLRYSLTHGYSPSRGSKDSAGLDLRIPKDYYLIPDMVEEVDLGISVEIPKYHFGMLVPRSSTGGRGLRLANTVGIIDSDYRGPLKARLVYTKPDGSYGDTMELKRGDRILQLIVVPYVMVNPTEVDQLSDTDRGSGGFGSTGV